MRFNHQIASGRATLATEVLGRGDPIVFVAAHLPVDLECAAQCMIRLDVTGIVGIQGWGDAAP